MLELAYDDPTGVTAAFNKNLLARINRELGGDFDLRAFSFSARYDERDGVGALVPARRAPRSRAHPGAGIEVDLRSRRDASTPSRRTSSSATR